RKRKSQYRAGYQRRSTSSSVGFATAPPVGTLWCLRCLYVLSCTFQKDQKHAGQAGITNTSPDSECAQGQSAGAVLYPTPAKPVVMEHVILVDENDNEVGTMEKMEAHRKGVLHRAFSILLFDETGRMLIQKRANDKYHSGNLWTNACCSHPLP